MWSTMMDGWTGYSPLGILFMLLFWALVILGIIALVRYIGNMQKTDRRDDGKPPMDILKERYAKGEIDKKEFDEKKKDLS